MRAKASFAGCSGKCIRIPAQSVFRSGTTRRCINGTAAGFFFSFKKNNYVLICNLDMLQLLLQGVQLQPKYFIHMGWVTGVILVVFTAQIFAVSRLC